MNLIVAIDKNWAIGNNGNLLEVLKGDMINFKNTTTDKIIVLGRATLTTFPGGKPLKNRTNIILTKNKDLKAEESIICHSIEELLKTLEPLNSEDVFIVGGASVYEQLLLYVDTAYITKFDKSHNADTYFPNLDLLPEWNLVETSEIFMENDIQYTFNIYKRKLIS